MNIRKHVYTDWIQCLFGLKFESYVLLLFFYVTGTMLYAYVCTYSHAISDFFN